MIKVIIVSFVTTAQIACAADDAQRPAAQNARARILQAFPYEPPLLDTKKGSTTGSEPIPAVLLPKVFVHAPKALVLRPEEVLSRAELAELVRTKYPGASLKGQDPLRYEGGLPNYGALMHAEDKRLLLLKDLTRLSDVLRTAGDTLGSTKLRKVIDEASVRKPDAFRDAMDKSANNGRR